MVFCVQILSKQKNITISGNTIFFKLSQNLSEENGKVLRSQYPNQNKSRMRRRAGCVFHLASMESQGSKEAKDGWEEGRAAAGVGEGREEEEEERSLLRGKGN